MPNGEVADEDRAPKPELMKAEEDVCGLAVSPLPNTGFADADEFVEGSVSPAVVVFESDRAGTGISCRAVR